MDDAEFNAQNEAVARLLCRQRGMDWEAIGEDGGDWTRPLDEPRRADFRDWAFAVQMQCRPAPSPTNVIS